MTRIEWDNVSDRKYETGLSNGVLYLEDQDGVPWNGLVEVQESTGSSNESHFFDGRKFATIGIVNNYTGKIKAITYPDEFAPYDGFEERAPGEFLGNRKKKIFGLSFKTLIMNDLTGQEDGYKIHILYNLTAHPEMKSYKTMDSNVDPMFFGWNIISRPVPLEGYNPTAYIIADSRYLSTGRLSRLEDVLYGTEETNAYLPPLETLLTILDSDFTIVITDNGNGTWTADGPSEYITMLDETTFQITDVEATYLDPDTYEVESTII